MSAAEWQAIFLSLKLASVSTALLLCFGLPLAYWLARSSARFKHLVEALVALPIVLPPTVLGFYLLLAFSPSSGLGQFWQQLTGSTLAFSFSGLVLASCLYSLPFVVQPLQAGFAQLDSTYVDAARGLQVPPLKRFWRIELPLIKHALIVATVLGFAHTLGEFGVVLMIGGNIPGETQVVAIALFDHVESLQFAEAHRLSLILLVFAFVVLLITYSYGKHGFRVWGQRARV